MFRPIGRKFCNILYPSIANPRPTHKVLERNEAIKNIFHQHVQSSKTLQGIPSANDDKLPELRSRFYIPDAVTEPDLYAKWEEGVLEGMEETLRCAQKQYAAYRK